MVLQWFLRLFIGYFHSFLSTFFASYAVLHQASFARRPSLYSQNEAKREQRPGNSLIILYYIILYYILSMHPSILQACLLIQYMLLFKMSWNFVANIASFLFSLCFFFSLSSFCARRASLAGPRIILYIRRTKRSESSVLAIRLYYILY